MWVQICIISFKTEKMEYWWRADLSEDVFRESSASKKRINPLIQTEPRLYVEILQISLYFIHMKSPCAKKLINASRKWRSHKQFDTFQRSFRASAEMPECNESCAASVSTTSPCSIVKMHQNGHQSGGDHFLFGLKEKDLFQKIKLSVCYEAWKRINN